MLIMFAGNFCMQNRLFRNRNDRRRIKQFIVYTLETVLHAITVNKIERYSNDVNLHC